MNWHIEIIATKLMALRTGKSRRLIINLPPRYLKSLLASIAFPDWRRGKVQVFGICAALPGQLCDPLRLTNLSMTIVFPCAIRRTVIDSDRHLGRRQRHDSAVLSQELPYGQSVPDIDKQVGREPGGDRVVPKARPAAWPTGSLRTLAEAGDVPVIPAIRLGK